MTKWEIALVSQAEHMHSITFIWMKSKFLKSFETPLLWISRSHLSVIKSAIKGCCLFSTGSLCHLMQEGPAWHTSEVLISRSYPEIRLVLGASGCCPPSTSRSVNDASRGFVKSEKCYLALAQCSGHMFPCGRLLSERVCKFLLEDTM